MPINGGKTWLFPHPFSSNLIGQRGTESPQRNSSPFAVNFTPLLFLALQTKSDPAQRNSVLHRETSERVWSILILIYLYEIFPIYKAFSCAYDSHVFKFSSKTLVFSGNQRLSMVLPHSE